MKDVKFLEEEKWMEDQEISKWAKQNPTPEPGVVAHTCSPTYTGG
jgi:hypothetical protein